jgi:hypothetical protein
MTRAPSSTGFMVPLRVQQLYRSLQEITESCRSDGLCCSSQNKESYDLNNCFLTHEQLSSLCEFWVCHITTKKSNVVTETLIQTGPYFSTFNSSLSLLLYTKMENHKIQVVYVGNLFSLRVELFFI